MMNGLTVKHRYMSCDIRVLNPSSQLILPSTLSHYPSKLYPRSHGCTHPVPDSIRVSSYRAPTPLTSYPNPRTPHLVQKLENHQDRPNWHLQERAFQFRLLEVDLLYHLVRHLLLNLGRAALLGLLVRILMGGRPFGRLDVSDG